MTVINSEFEKAVSRLEEALKQKKNDFIRDSVIQRFEFSIELAWKTAKKTMGTPTVAPKDIVREMAQSGYIDNVDVWLRAIDMRNLSSHTYKEDVAEKVYAFAADFLSELHTLLPKLRSK
ncbi:MAG: HI0074 family nucleotidyltransferase substrate-binding subunit [Parachlamydiales bacterium]